MLDYQSLFQCLSNAIHAIIPRRPSTLVFYNERTPVARSVLASEFLSQHAIIRR